MFQAIYNAVSISHRKAQPVSTAMAFFELSRLLSAGVTLSDALNDLTIMDRSGVHAQSWKNVAARVSSGSTLSQALAMNAAASDGTVIALLKAGEADGRLHLACDAIYDHLQWHIDLRQRLLTLLIYPLFSLGVLLAVTGFLFISVVPSIKAFLLSSGDELAWHTHALIGLSSWMNHYYVTALTIILLAVGAMLMIWTVSRQIREFGDRCVLSLPLIGAVIRDLTLSRYAQCCAQLYANGIVLESSMALAEGVVSNRFLRAELSKVRTRVIAGATLEEAMRGVPVLPSLFTRLVAVGELSGQLATVLTRIGEHQSAATDASIKRLEQLLGPLVLLLVGVMLLWIVVSVLAPVYNMAIATVVGAS